MRSEVEENRSDGVIHPLLDLALVMWLVLATALPFAPFREQHLSLIFLAIIRLQYSIYFGILMQIIFNTTNTINRPVVIELRL